MERIMVVPFERKYVRESGQLVRAASDVTAPSGMDVVPAFSTVVLPSKATPVTTAVFDVPSVAVKVTDVPITDPASDNLLAARLSLSDVAISESLSTTLSWAD